MHVVFLKKQKWNLFYLVKSKNMLNFANALQK